MSARRHAGVAHVAFHLNMRTGDRLVRRVRQLERNGLRAGMSGLWRDRCLDRNVIGRPGGFAAAEDADAAPDASLYVGLKRGVTRAEFERKIADGSVADCFHRIPVKARRRDVFAERPSSRHRRGLVIFEIQQNSDTTYRVFDWNRVGLDGQPRELHVAQSLASIDFNDFEPRLVETTFSGGQMNVAAGAIQKCSLVKDPLFNVEAWKLRPGANGLLEPNKLQIIALTGGSVEINGGSASVSLSAGAFSLIPASLERTEIIAKSAAALLRVEAN